MPTTYLAEGEYFADGNAYFDVVLPEQNPRNPYQFGPFFNISRIFPAPVGQINAIAVYMKIAHDPGNRLPQEGSVLRKRFHLDELINYDGEVASFNRNLGNSLLVIFHDNAFNYDDVTTFFNNVRQNYTSNIGSVVDMFIQVERNRAPRKAGMSLITRGR